MPLVFVAGVASAGSGASRTTITVFAAPQPPPAQYGGVSYGGYAPPSGALVTEQRDVDVSSTAEVRVSGVAATIDPASVQLRDLTDPAGTTVREQRFVPGATTPDEILAHHIGEPVAVMTPKGEVDGVLRAVDLTAIVLEVGTGDQRHLQMMRRDGFVQDVRMTNAAGADKPTLVWRLAAKKPGKHTVEISYRADGMQWNADYLAILDDAQKTVDFSAWATIKNATGATYDGADVTLVSGGATSLAPGAAGGSAAMRPVAPPQRFAVPGPVHIGAGESVQVELVKPRVGAKARSVVTFESIPDTSASFQAYPGVDCNQWNTSTGASGRAEVAIEIDGAAQGPLPDGRVRMFKRKADRLELVSEDQLHASSAGARIRLAPDSEIVGERHATACNYDERARSLHEKIEIKIENKGKQTADIVVREFLWRWPVWRIDPADETVRGTRGGPQTQEYRVTLPPGGKKTLAYGVVYTW